MTLDTNVAVYAFSQDGRAVIAREVLAGAHFLSAQVLNEYANVARRKRQLEWSKVRADLAVICRNVPVIHVVDEAANRDAVRIAERYELSFYDALMLAVALSGGAETIYSEDMQHGLVIDDTLRIVDPFR